MDAVKAHQRAAFRAHGHYPVMQKEAEDDFTLFERDLDEPDSLLDATCTLLACGTLGWFTKLQAHGRGTKKNYTFAKASTQP